MSRYQFFLLYLLVGSLPLGQLQADEGNTLYVEVQSSKLRQQPQFWAPAVVAVSYGDVLRELEQRGSWFQVEVKQGPTAQKGFLHQTAVTRKHVVLKTKPEAFDTEVDQSDIVLAGKGFNSDIESNYSSQDQGLNYQAVDQVESFQLEGDALYSFIRVGKLNDEEG